MKSKYKKNETHTCDQQSVWYSDWIRYSFSSFFFFFYSALPNGGMVANMNCNWKHTVKMVSNMMKYDCGLKVLQILYCSSSSSLSTNIRTEDEKHFSIQLLNWNILAPDWLKLNAIKLRIFYRILSSQRREYLKEKKNQRRSFSMSVKHLACVGMNQ